MQPPMSSRIAALRLPGLCPRDLAVCGSDAESPVDVRGLLPGTPHGAYSRPLELPQATLAGVVPSAPCHVPALPVVQNEIKKAQNRKSAKRFREAQKRRWANLQEELLASRELVASLRSELAAHEAGKRDGRDAMSINTLLDGPVPLKVSGRYRERCDLADVEASLYAQLLQSRAPVTGTQRPYVSELGVLICTLIVSPDDGGIRAVRKGLPASPVDNVLSGVAGEELRAALRCGEPIAVGYIRGGVRYNAVVKPLPGGPNVLFAEFKPHSS